MFKKILITVLIIIIGFASASAIWNAWFSIYDVIYNSGSVDWWEVIIVVLGAILITIPTWYAWKGTKFIPFITILPIRILLIILSVFFIQPLLIFFAVWGLWIKS